MAIWGIGGASVAFVLGCSPEYGLAVCLVGIAVGALQSAKMISEFKANGPVFTPRDIHKPGDL